MCGGTAAESECHQGLAGSGDATCTCMCVGWVRKGGREGEREGGRGEGERERYI